MVKWKVNRIASLLRLLPTRLLNSGCMSSGVGGSLPHCLSHGVSLLGSQPGLQDGQVYFFLLYNCLEPRLTLTNLWLRYRAIVRKLPRLPTPPAPGL